MTSEYERGHAVGREAGIREAAEALRRTPFKNSSPQAGHAELEFYCAVRNAILELLDSPAPAGVRVKPLVWGYHPAGTIAAPPTGHAYIIDTRMKGRVYSVKGFNPEREFGSLDEAKAAAQADYEARIMAALEPVPAEVTVPKTLLDVGYAPGGYTVQCIDCPKDMPFAERAKRTAAKRAWRCEEHAVAALRALSEGDL